MADTRETIEAWIRLRDKARFKRDMRDAKDSVEDLGDEGVKTAAKLALIEKGKKGDSSVDILGKLGSSLNSVSGRLKLAAGAATIFAPAMVAVGSSLAGAAVGAGLLGATGLGAVVVGLGGLVPVAMQAFHGLSDVRTAQQALTQAQLQYGRNSTQAATAQARLNAVLLQAGPYAAQLNDEINSISDSWRSMTGPARTAIAGLGLDALRGARPLLATLAGETNTTAIALRRDLAPSIRELAGPEVRAGISDLSETFRGLAGPAVRGAVDLLIVLLRYARAAGPYVIDVAQGFAEWASGLRNTSDGATQAGSQVSTLVGHLQAWAHLLAAVGGLAVAVFGASEASGLDLVQAMTEGVQTLTAWIEQANASGASQETFSNWADLAMAVTGALVQLLSIIGQLAQAALPGLTSGADGLQIVFGLMLFKLQLLTAAIEFLGPLTGPAIVAFFAFRTALMAAAFGAKALDIAMRMTTLGWIVTAIGLVIGAVILLYNKWDWFRNAVDGIWAWMKTAAMDVFGFIRGEVNDTIHDIKKVIDWLSQAKEDAAGFLGQGKGGGLLGLGGIDKFGIPGFATGGQIMPGGGAIVGETGPEIAWNNGQSTTISPLTRKPAPGIPDVRPISGMVYVRTEVPVTIDRREIANVVAEAIQDARSN